MPYAWNGLSFEIPSSVVDQTVLSFVDNPEAPTFTVTVSKDIRGDAPFAAYVKAQLDDLVRALPGYASTSQEEQSVNGRAALVVEHKARSPQGTTMRQRQAWVDLEGGVAILAVTWPDKPNPKARDAFDSILKSMR